MTTIQLPDDQARALEAKAAAHGVSLDAWVQKLVSDDTTPATTATIDWVPEK
jgi:plasmid stability protein